jgi:hypothetical protein
MKILKLSLLLSFLIFNHAFSGDTIASSSEEDPVYFLRSEADVKKLEDANPQLLAGFKEQLYRLTDTAHVISITSNSTKPLPLDLKISEKRRERLVPMLEALGMKVKIIDAQTPSDVDPEAFKKLQQYFTFSERYVQEVENWPNEMLKDLGKTPYWWNKCDNWKRKVPGTNEKCVCPWGSLRQLACFGSHLKALKLAENGKTTLKIEDDADLCISKKILEMITQSIDQLTAIEWDSFALGYSAFRQINDTRQVVWDAGRLHRLTGAGGQYAEIINGNSLGKVISILEGYSAKCQNGDENNILAVDDLISRCECQGAINRYTLPIALAGQSDNQSLTCDRPNMTERIARYDDVIGQGRRRDMTIHPISRLLFILEQQQTGDLPTDLQAVTSGLQARAKRLKSGENIFIPKQTEQNQ